MTMKINAKNTAALEKALAAVQHKSKVRTITAAQIAEEVERIEAKLVEVLPKRAWLGVLVRVDLNAQTFTSAYLRKGRPESTVFMLERFPSGWFVVSLRRDTTMSLRHILNVFNHKKPLVVSHVIDRFNRAG